MTKKNFVYDARQKAVEEVIAWKPPVFHQASECYVSLSAFDPAKGYFRTKKIMLGHIKGKRAQRRYGEALIQRLSEKLMQGWNPWIEAVQPLEYTSFTEVCDKYRDYVLKMVREGHLREETAASYLSRMKVMREWIEKGKEGARRVYYAYQFNSNIVGQFLDYIFIDRNNTLQTRNNYLLWVKVFCKYLTERGYVPSDPSANFRNVQPKRKTKDRDVIPDSLLAKIRDWLTAHHRHYLLACYILHYCLVRPREMSFLKVGDFSVRRQTLSLHGDHTKNHNDAVITVPKKVLQLMIDLCVFDYPGSNYLFSDDFRPGRERRSEKAFRDFWNRSLRPALNFSVRYKFYSLKDTGITNMLRANTDLLSVRDQARHSSVLITDIYTPKDIKQANKLLLNYKGVL